MGIGNESNGSICCYTSLGVWVVTITWYMDIYKVSQGSINTLRSTSTSTHTVFARAKWVRKQHLLSVITTNHFHRMTDLPTLIKQSRDLERKIKKIKKIKTRNANRDLIDTLEAQIDQQTEKLNDINGNIQSSQKQMLDVCDELGEAARQVKRLSKYDRSDLEVVLVSEDVHSSSRTVRSLYRNCRMRRMKRNPLPSSENYAEQENKSWRWRICWTTSTRRFKSTAV